MHYSNHFFKKILIRYHLIFIFGFINCSVSYSQGDWVNFIVKNDMFLISVFSDLELDYKKPNYKNLVIVGTNFKACLKNGFPKDAGLEQLIAVSDSTEIIIENLTKYKLAGVITFKCNGFDVFYVKDTINIRQNLQKMFRANFSESEYFIHIKRDKNWEYYYTNLYPKDVSDAFFMDHEYLAELVYEGDDLTEKRTVYHWVYFNNTKKRDKFKDRIKKFGFSIDSVNYNKERKYPYELQFSRKNHVDPESISKLTEMLRIFSIAWKGEYGGWATEVVIKE